MFHMEHWGSSPLARGLPWSRARRCAGPGIIPARAGFTVVIPGRVGGPQGSSPLARGLPDDAAPAENTPGIIPARAGFTTPSRAPTWWAGDHPRSRGVYCTQWAAQGHRDGSSPLARGLPVPPGPIGGHIRIIPARAGFTPSSSLRQSATGDHPRSRGVYTCGSLESQRTRTLPDPGCLHCRPRVRSAELR